MACGAILIASTSAPRAPDYVYTVTPRYDAEAWMSGQDRFPRGAAVRLVSQTGTRDVAPGFYASADPEVSFDAQRVLFAAKPRREDPWQIWEVTLPGGEPRKVAAWQEESIRPLYLPDNKIVYARKSPSGYRLEVLAIPGGQPLPLTYAPGNYLTCDVLHDGRVMYESAGELYTVYPDGSGVEAYRCDHGVSRHAARQLQSRDVVFTTERGLARFTSASAIEARAAPAHSGSFAGPIAEISPDQWLAAFRPTAAAPYAIYAVMPTTGTIARLSGTPGVQPVMVAARETPLRFPSGLHDWAGANLLCLNSYSGKRAIASGSISSVRLYGQNAAGQPIKLGETAVESDGSFFLHVPGEQPLRLELRDGAGAAIQAEHGWFWMRSGEQRVCEGCHAGPERAPENAVPKVLLREDVPIAMTGEKP